MRRRLHRDMLQQALADAAAATSPAASAPIRPPGAGATRIRRCLPTRCCAACRSWAPSARFSIPSPGDDTTIDRGGPAYNQFQSVHGPAFRGVYDLADLDRCLFIMAPGQSGNLLSRHARDFLTRWRDGTTITLGPQPATATATIRLTP